MRKIFLRWEIDFFTNYLRRPMGFAYIAMVAAALSNEDVTKDEFRKDLGFEPHPDPERGAQFIWEEHVAKEGDDVIPPQVLDGARLRIQENEAGLTAEERHAKYPLLFPAV